VEHPEQLDGFIALFIYPVFARTQDPVS